MGDMKPVEVPVKEGEELDVTIESTGKKGDGIAKIDNYTIIVPEAKMNQKLKIRIIRTLPTYAFAEIIE